jgi:FkbM family methyltransferase
MIFLKYLYVKFFSIFRKGQKSVKFFRDENTGLFIAYRKDSSDLRVYNQVILNEEYQPLIGLIKRHKNEKEIYSIIDAGANIGLTSLYFKMIFKNALVLALEPNTDSYSLLKINTFLNKFKNIRSLQKAVWHTTKALVPNTEFRDGKEWSFAVSESDINDTNPKLFGISISDLMEISKLNEIDILKIDIEGAEFEVFNGKLDFLEKTKYIAIEIHPEKGDPIFIYKILDKMGFIHFTQGETCFGYKASILKV